MVSELELFLLSLLAVERLLELTWFVYCVGVDVELAVLRGEEDLTIGELKEILEDLDILDVPLIPRHVVALHLQCDEVLSSSTLGSHLHSAYTLDHALDEVTIVAVLDEVAWVLGLLRLVLDGLLGDGPLGVVDIELEVGHDSEVIPVDGLLVDACTLLGYNSLHGAYDTAGTSIPLLTIRDRLAVGYHILDMAAVLGENDGGQLIVIFHVVWSVTSDEP